MLKSVHYKIILCYFLAVIVCIGLVQSYNYTASAWSQHTSNDRKICIAIDAGHGGIDGGAVSISGIPESHTNLQIAQRLNDLFHLLGYQTIMLRDTDTSLHTDGTSISAQKASDLKHRVQIVTEENATLMISIHQNTFSDKRYSGAQVFYHADEKSLNLATDLQNNFIAILNPGSSRKPKLAKGIYLMEHIPCPGMLIECGFLTNVQEDALLQSADYQKQLCSVIAATISKNPTWQTSIP